MKNYPEYKGLNLPSISNEILLFWEKEKIFEKSISSRKESEAFVFYEGPPSANGLPGIHHVMSRTIKDLFCRYQTLNGKKVERKAGWDTHGLPIELAVEKTLGITKEDIGKKISIEDYNLACRKEVMKYQDKWEELTSKMGYWVDMKKPYITYENNYIESVWWLLKTLYSKSLLYKGYTIQPYSPAAGTGLSTHELNQPGCYRNVRDTSAVAMFKVLDSGKNISTSEKNIPHYFLAWTTTPWTLPSNTSLAFGAKIEYVFVKTFSPFSHQECVVVLAKDLFEKYFSAKNEGLAFEDYKAGDKNIPYKIIQQIQGRELEGIRYEPLFHFAKPEDGDSYITLLADFVTTEDGTGIVHLAPSFGADDFRVAKQNGIGSLTLVDRRGKFLPEVQDGIFLYGEEFVKEAYLSDQEKDQEFKKQKTILESKGKIKELKEYLSVDERIVLKLQEEGKLFKKEKFEHSYPHCWRTDKPILYYPLDSWFVKVTAYKERMSELNKTIHWKPEHTGTGRFGEWLNNLQDWNLSRSRFWGIPLPIWRTEDKLEEICIGSIEELRTEISKAQSKGLNKDFDLKADFDLHKPFIDRIVLLSASGKEMTRELDLIDVWFDSGSMPYAQWHYPFENQELFKENFPADFIAEGVDQTRGWFYTLHAIAVLCFDSVAYKNVVSNGLVLDKSGNKMSKRLGNTVDPFTTLSQYGADAVRWYMVANTDPWENLRFDLDGVTEKQRTFFGTLYNTYSFFALYANIDSFQMDEANAVPMKERSELDRWIISKLNSLKQEVAQAMNDFDATPACRAIENFVDVHLSNWYVRLSRRRFWKGEMSKDKKAAYETLFECLLTTAQLSSPVAPFFSDWLYKNLTDRLRNTSPNASRKEYPESIHLTLLNKVNASLIHPDLEERMEIAQKFTSMILSIRKKENIRVRQPLKKIRIPVLNESFQKKIEAVQHLLLSEVNVKEIEFVGENDAQIIKNLKLNFKTLGKKSGKHMKELQAFAIAEPKTIIYGLEKEGRFVYKNSEIEIEILPEDAEIIPVDIPGWKVANSGSLTVALDVNISAELREEGIARELINRIQNLRKDKNFDVTDKIIIQLQKHEKLDSAILNFLNYICSEILAESLEMVQSIDSTSADVIDIEDGLTTKILISKFIFNGKVKN